VYETTYGLSQNGVTDLQSGVPVHFALSPSAHTENFAQQPDAAQPHVPGSWNTEWQSVRASHAASVVAAEHGAAHFGCAHAGGPSLGVVQRRKLFPVHVGQ
jgi:hypothetical protein